MKTANRTKEQEPSWARRKAIKDLARPSSESGRRTPWQLNAFPLILCALCDLLFQLLRSEQKVAKGAKELREDLLVVEESFDFWFPICEIREIGGCSRSAGAGRLLALTLMGAISNLRRRAGAPQPSRFNLEFPRPTARKQPR